MSLRHVPIAQRLTRLGEDLRTPLGDVVAHRRVGQVLRAMLIDQPSQDPAGGVPLLLRRVQVGAQHLVDLSLERLQPRRSPGRRLA